MLRSLLFGLFFSLSGVLFAQNFQISTNLGFGNVVGEDFPRGKYSIYLQPVFRVSDNYYLGAEIGIGNTIFPGDAVVQREDQVIIDALDSRFIFLHLQNKFLFEKKKITKYAGFGLGTTQLNLEINEPDIIRNDDFKTWNFSMNAEAGLRFNNYEIGLKYIYGGKSPSYMGQTIDSTNREVILEEKTLNIVLITIGYLFGIE